MDPRVYRESTYTVQRYLRTLHTVDPAIPLINPDGIYGPETTEAAKAFQQKNDLPVTGNVDFETWELLREQAAFVDELLAMPKALNVFGKGELPLTPGTYSGEVYLLQALLNALALRYQNLERVDVTGVYDAKTQKQISALQGILSLEQTGILDKALWDKMAAIWK